MKINRWRKAPHAHSPLPAGEGPGVQDYPAPVADVCLLLEGTFPYVRGGVSSWVNQLIKGLPELRFSLVFLGWSRENHGAPVYPLPRNVVHLESHFLLEDEPDEPARLQQRRSLRSVFARLRAAHEPLRDTEGDPYRAGDLLNLLLEPEGIARHHLEESEGAWKLLRDRYLEAPPGLDFNHYFWTVRTMHAPLFKLAAIARNAPPAALYHSVSTGYAGFLGALLQRRTGRPMVLTEHGIYTKEREIDLSHVDWIPEEADPFRAGIDDSMGYLRQLWIRFFYSLGRMTYQAADPIISLYGGNRARQIQDGAPGARTRVIPNGIAIERFRAVRRAPDAPVPPVLALIGRIVPIKDVKTFVRTMRVLCTRLPEAEGWLIGPEEEDPAYVAECKALVRNLGLERNVRFLGFQRMEEVLPRIGLTVLTSISEGQPLVLLESFAAGIPAVTTDVGSCRELIEGGREEDRALGQAGAIVPIASPGETADAALTLLTDRRRWTRASVAAMRRVEKYYDEPLLFKRYRDIYREARERSRTPTATPRTARG